VPRHPPNALKTLDRSHCRYSPPGHLRDRKRIRLERPSCFTFIQRIDASRQGRQCHGPPAACHPCECHTPLGPGICVPPQRATHSRINVSSPCQTTPQPHSGTGETPSSFPGSRKNAFLLGQLRNTLFPQEDGGARRDRTDDLLNANQALSQLSYGPSKMVGLGRLELPTSRLSSARSNQLSYKPVSAQKRPAPFDAGHPVQSLSVKKEKRRRRCPAL
jgi:hypothetical protein